MCSAIHLAELNVSSTGLDANSASVVAWLLRHNPILRLLDVSCNQLGVAGSSVIADSLACARSLTRLAMSETQLCSAGGTDPSALTMLSKAIEELSALRELEASRRMPCPLVPRRARGVPDPRP